MGKHERELIKKAEKIIIKILKSRKVGRTDKNNQWFKHACSVAEEIKKGFPQITSVSHLGDRYDSIGDVLIISKGRKSFLEIKMSDTKMGIGTMANISQNALTENTLFKENTKSWSEFRDTKKHEKWVSKYLDEHNGYPKSILSIKNSATRNEEKARYLRALSKKGNAEASTIMASIQKRDRKEKIDYLQYLNIQEQRPEMVKRFLILIMLGFHTQDILKKLINKKNILKGVQKLFIYYANSNGNKIIIRREDAGARVKEILGNYPTFKIIFPKGLTHCKIVRIKGKSRKPLLQIVFHWKNIAQGIKTPCLNIFDLTKR